MTCSIRWALAALFVLTGSWPGSPAWAQTAPNAPASQFKPVETPTLDPELLKMPKPAPDVDAAQVKIKKPDQAASQTKLPNQVDLGKYQLQFNAGHTSDVAPRTGFDSGETSNLSKITPGEKSETALPDYFGLKLSTPVH